ncbi:hypothetical protein JWG45_08020 [Leptospira sp. 201903070]|uniref:Lipoprotein n=1 Tax=Leptospira ainlahdjerensis TaxID=2810033 RepID=A0ABS2UBC2_9LEPT|nr:hypothetical protein [Leptospira ainlahdjerensis]MBM9577099.1 hypothetical protein [Leptospira ainlahdjerensis]
MKLTISKTIIVSITIFLSIQCNSNKKGPADPSTEDLILGFLLLNPNFSISGGLSETGKIASDHSQASASQIQVTTSDLGAGSLSISDLDVLASVMDPRIGSILKSPVKRSAPNRSFFTIEGGNGGTDGNGTFEIAGDINGESISFFMMDQTVRPFLTCPIQQTLVSSISSPQGFVTVADGGQLVINGSRKPFLSSGSQFIGTTQISGAFTFTDYGKLTADDAAFVRVLTPEGKAEILAPYNDPNLTPCEQAQQAFQNGARILSRYIIVKAGTAVITTKTSSVENKDGSTTHEKITDIHAPEGLLIERRNYPENISEVLESKLVRFDNVRFTSKETSDYSSIFSLRIDRKVTVDGVIDGKTVHEDLQAKIGR